MKNNNIKSNVKNMVLALAFGFGLSATGAVFAEIAESNALQQKPLFVKHFDTEKQALEASTALLNPYRGNGGACVSLYLIDQDHMANQFEMTGFKGKHSCVYYNTKDKRGVADVEVD